MRHVILLRCFLIAALAALAVGLGFSSAHAGQPQAYPICASVYVSGAAGPHSVGQCVPYTGSTLCHTQWAQLGSVLYARASACHPW